MRIRSLQRYAFNVLGETGLRLFAPRYAGLGVIFALHRIIPDGQPHVYPGYELAAAFLDRLLGYVRRAGWEIVALGEAVRRLENNAKGKRFACFTFDDGYADNYTLALPIFERYNAPLSVYITSGILNRNIFYWWGALEDLVLANDAVEVPIPGEGTRTFPAHSMQEKLRVFETLDRLCHTYNDRYFPELEAVFHRYGVDARRSLDRDAMTLEQARALARHPLVTIGAHGVSHQRLALLSEAEMAGELECGRRELQGLLGVPVDHLAYPFGGPDACGSREFRAARAAGYRTAVTLRRGNLHPGHRHHLHALPRRTFSPDLSQVRNCLYGVESILRKSPPFVTE